MHRPKSGHTTGALLVIFTCSVTASAIEVEWVTVGDPGNPHDDIRYGGVGCVYRIGKYEVTNEQYIAFLNAVARDETDLYSTLMTGKAGGIQRTGSPGDYRYGPKDGDAAWLRRPVTFVDLPSACRFANWMHNGQPVGPPDQTTTEDGAYNMSSPGIPTRKPGAKVFLPNEDEWHKAAYYKGGGTNAGYWDYATCSDAAPDNNAPPWDSGNSANYSGIGSGYSVGAPYYVTEVGAYTRSVGPYGTFDQNGNVREWTETIANGSYAVTRGGSWWNGQAYQKACYRAIEQPGTSSANIGFRLASMAPEPPASDLLIAAGLIAACLSEPADQAADNNPFRRPTRRHPPRMTTRLNREATEMAAPARKLRGRYSKTTWCRPLGKATARNR